MSWPAVHRFLVKDCSAPRNLLLCDKLFTDVGRSLLVFSAIHTQLNSYVFSGLTVESGRSPLFATYGLLSYRNYYAQCLINIVQDSSVVVVKKAAGWTTDAGVHPVSTSCYSPGLKRSGPESDC
jgi:hypothetical protein